MTSPCDRHLAAGSGRLFEVMILRRGTGVAGVLR
ncbi:MAG: hypothetical protein QOE97_2132 [Pseudonocardiales bacterium]|jgi:hypothetical protein|nr:hypothetical protein [Pseudonocardiales bacterium]